MTPTTSPHARPLRRDGWRILYIAELVLIVLPLALILLKYLVFLAFLSIGGLVFSLSQLATEGGNEAVETLIFASGGTAVCVLAVGALWQFAVLSAAYLSQRQMPRRHWHFRYWGGLLAALPPLIVSFGLATPILVPVLHLGFFGPRAGQFDGHAARHDV